MRRGFKHSLPPRGKAVLPASPSPGACPRPSPPHTSSVVVGMSGSKAPRIGTRLKDDPLPPGTGAPTSRALLVSAGWFCTFFFFQKVGNFLAHFPIGQKMLEKMQMEHVPASLLQILRPEPEKFSALVPASQNHKKEGATHLVPSDFFLVPLSPCRGCSASRSGSGSPKGSCPAG